MHKIRLEVAKTNLIAYEMYTKSGFEKIGDNDSNILMESEMTVCKRRDIHHDRKRIKIYSFCER